MAYWNVGIDESGVFTYYNTKGKHSFVCAAITQESPDELKEKFANLFYMMKGREHRNDWELLSYFHAMERSNDDNNTIFSNLKNSVYKAVVSKGRPLVLCNPQHWWLSGVMSVLRQIVMLDEIKTGDTLDIFLATRSMNVVGLFVNNYENNSQEEGASWKRYHEILQGDLLRWIKAVDKKVLNIYLHCVPANESGSVTLADQTVGMVWKNCTGYLGNKVCYTECADFYEMYNVESSASDRPLGNTNENACKRFMEESNYLTALQFWLRAFFAKENIPFKLFSDIMKGAYADVHTYVEAWKIVLDTCEYALDNRGEDSQLIDRVFKLEPELQNEYARVEGLKDVHLLMDIWRVLEKVSSHRGDTNCKVLDYVDSFWKKGGQEIGSTLDRWKSYLQTKLIGAQIPFNGYDFASVSDRMEPLLDCHEKLCGLPFPFENATVDDELAALLGTCGQAAAFQENLDDAISCFEDDYANSSEGWKSMPASFMVTVLHRKQDFESACAWFEKQTGGDSFESFGKTLSSSSDKWLMINYFKILVLAQMQERNVEPIIPDLESWNIQNSYPWPLVLKWAAFALMLSGQGERGVELLDTAHKLLQKGGFTIKTLSLPILQMLYCVTEDEQYEAAYKELLENLTASCKMFKAYVENHSESFALDKDKGLWNAAMILPFNYA